MKKFNIYNETEERIDKDLRLIKNVLNHAIEFEQLDKVYFNVIIVDNDYIHNLNKDYRKIDRETDVITFALEDYDKGLYNDIRILGDIYISIDRAKEQALEYGHSEIRELCFLAVHGFLHLLGYDHMKKEDEKIMFERQEMILNEEEYSKRG